MKVQRLHEESMQVINCLNEMYSSSSSSTNFSYAGAQLPHRERVNMQFFPTWLDRNNQLSRAGA